MHIWIIKEKKEIMLLFLFDVLACPLQLQL
jgi:hypothetical protein